MNSLPLSVGNGSHLLGPVFIQRASDAIVDGGSTVEGQLECSSGGDAYCEDPSNVGGAFGCGSCAASGAATEAATRSGDSRPDLSRMRQDLRSMMEKEKLD